MALSPGARLGPYVIDAPLGSGGMEVVYRARDARLNRDVALKILPDAFAGDPNRLARLTREAQWYDVTADGQRFLMLKADVNHHLIRVQNCRGTKGAGAVKVALEAAECR